MKLLPTLLASKFTSLAVVVTLAVAVPATVFVAQQQQNLSQQAAAPALSPTPTSQVCPTPNTPIDCASGYQLGQVPSQNGSCTTYECIQECKIDSDCPSGFTCPITVCEQSPRANGYPCPSRVCVSKNGSTPSFSASPQKVKPGELITLVISSSDLVKKSAYLFQIKGTTLEIADVACSEWGKMGAINRFTCSKTTYNHIPPGRYVFIIKDAYTVDSKELARSNEIEIVGSATVSPTPSSCTRNSDCSYNQVCTTDSINNRKCALPICAPQPGVCQQLHCGGDVNPGPQITPGPLCPFGYTCEGDGSGFGGWCIRQQDKPTPTPTPNPCAVPTGMVFVKLGGQPDPTPTPCVSQAISPTPVASQKPFDTHCAVDNDCTFFKIGSDPSDPCANSCLDYSSPQVIGVNRKWLLSQQGDRSCAAGYMCTEPVTRSHLSYSVACKNSVCQKYSKDTGYPTDSPLPTPTAQACQTLYQTWQQYFGKTCGPNSSLDFNNDGLIDIRDQGIIRQHSNDGGWCKQILNTGNFCTAVLPTVTGSQLGPNCQNYFTQLQQQHWGATCSSGSYDPRFDVGGIDSTGNNVEIADGKIGSPDFWAFLQHSDENWCAQRLKGIFTNVCKTQSQSCNSFDGNIQACHTAGCSYYACGNKCRPAGTPTDQVCPVCRNYDSSVHSCDNHGDSCAYYFCSNQCWNKGTANSVACPGKSDVQAAVENFWGNATKIFWK